MHTNQSIPINCKRMTRILVVCFVLTGLFIMIGSAVRERGSQGMSEVKLSVEDPRPLAKAIETLEKKYGWVITYEDPRYVHDSEIVDVALKIRRDLDKFKPGERVPPAFVPRGGILEFTYDVVSKTNLPTNPAMVVQKLLDAQAARDNGGKFRLETSGQIMHVIPTMIKNSEGTLIPQESVLDAIISLPAEDRTVYDKLESICSAISRVTKIPVTPGLVPDNWFNRERDQQGAVNQKARDVLINTFKAMDYGSNLSWRLFYSPGTKKYFLNIHLVSKRDG